MLTPVLLLVLGVIVSMIELILLITNANPKPKVPT